MQKIRLAAGAAAGIASAVLLLQSCVEKDNLKPNIIVFLADDLGYGDLACYNNNGFHTPAVESIANQGVRFTTFYTNGQESSPTRAALLTGRYQHRVGGLECAIGTGNVGRYDDAIRLRETNDLGLPVSETSIAQLLKKAGYNTAICGKWHLGYENKFSPNLHGFDYAFYALGGGMDYFHHRENSGPDYLEVLLINGKPVTMPGYFTDLVGNEAIKFIDKQDGQTPFFLYVPFTAPHAPYQGPDDYLPEPLPDTSYLWNQSKGPKHIYQAMIRSMDENIGEVLDKLEEKRLSENTLVIFMSDNGGTTSGDNGPLRGFKGNLFEGGIRVPCVVKWPGKIPEGIVSEQPCITMDISASIARIAGAEIPDNRKFDGIDILNYIEKNQSVEERTLFWRARRGEQTRKAVRKGDMKYIRMDNAGKIEEYLFDLNKDMRETTNLFESSPDLVTEMKELLNEWEQEVMAVRTCLAQPYQANTVRNSDFQFSGGDKTVKAGVYDEIPTYKDPSVRIEQRVEDLLSRMTLEEKIGQMNMPCVYVSGLGKDVKSKMEGCRKFTEGTQVPGLGPGGGFFTLPNNILFEGARQQAEFMNELQKIAVEKTRLQIPLLMTEEGTHGLMCSGGTIFPEGLAVGSTWNLDLVEEIYATAAREARAIGIHQLFTLVIEPNRDPRLGRNEEGYSEDPWLCSRIAESIVRGTQGDDISSPDKVVAGLCHYPGQSQPVSGLERGAMEISERMLREVFLPPWVAGIKKSGALGVMATYPAIDGIPAHVSEEILTGILREELGFEGLVLGEGGGIGTPVYEHIVENQKEAGALVLKSGLDVGISYEDGYMIPMIENVKEGKVSMDMIDRAVRRILRQKFRLGLFENPYVDPDHAVSVSNTKENQELALQVAREGIVLLKNENNLLPLKKDLRSIAVIGPNSDDGLNQLGDYTARVVLQDISTVLDGIKGKVPEKTKITYVKGCNITGNDLNEIAKAQRAAKSSDVAIVVVGESQTKPETNGEGYDVASLDLTGLQEDLLKAVYSTGTPVVVVLINGRPLSIRWTAENIPAIVEAWNCGEQGGKAIADVIFGDFNPEGRLTITFPRHSGQLPVYYNHKPSKEHWIKDGWGKAYADMPATPLWEFGFGLSYTNFEYSNLVIKPDENGPEGEFIVSLDVTNTGKRYGSEVVQLYLRDKISSVTRPVKELKGFEKVKLNPGEKKKVEFIVGPDHLSFLDRNLNTVVEPGVFELMAGSSSENIRLKGEFKVK